MAFAAAPESIFTLPFAEAASPSEVSAVWRNRQ